MIDLLCTPIPFWVVYLLIGAFLGIMLELIDVKPFSDMPHFIAQQTLMTVGWPILLIMLFRILRGCHE